MIGVGQLKRSIISRPHHIVSYPSSSMDTSIHRRSHHDFRGCYSPTVRIPGTLVRLRADSFLLSALLFCRLELPFTMAYSHLRAPLYDPCEAMYDQQQLAQDIVVYAPMVGEIVTVAWFVLFPLPDLVFLKYHQAP